MTHHGLVKIEAAKKSGLWNQDARPTIDLEPCKEFLDVLEKNRKAKEFFERLPPSSREYFVGWVNIAKREETKQNRIRESIVLLEQGKRLGLK